MTENLKRIASAAIILVVLLFIVSNLQTVSVDFIAVAVSAPLGIVVLATTAAGMALGRLLTRRRAAGQ